MRNITSYLNDKLKSSEHTVYNKSDPKMNIIVSRARTSVMDSDYWTVETIRESPNLGDISVAPRRYKPYGPPNRIYEIHVDNGIVGTSIREYPDRLKEGWKEQFILGSGSSVAIGFNGNWEAYRKRWRLITEECPWIFWVDENNILWRQHWDDESTKSELAYNVTSVKAIRAWKNKFFLERDQGIVVAYILKDGSIWYRSYSQQLNGNYAWEEARQLLGFHGGAISLNMFITNDYRMGFTIESSEGEIYWYLTKRNWAGMAIETDKITISPYQLSTEFIPLTYLNVFIETEKISISPTSINVSRLFANTYNEITGVSNIPDENGDWGWIIEFSTLNKIPNLTLDKIKIIDEETPAFILIDRVEAISERTYRLYLSSLVVETGLHNILGNVSIVISDSLNEAGYTYLEFSDSFKPVNQVWVDIPLPEVEKAWNE